MNSLKTPKPLLAARIAYPILSALIVLLLGEWIARGSLTPDTFMTLIFPHAEAYLLAWLLLYLVWLLVDWGFRLPPLSTLVMGVLGCAPCAVNFYTLQLRGEPFLPGSGTGVGGRRCGIRSRHQDPDQHGRVHRGGAGADGGQLFPVPGAA